jgi:hypothetical protein
MDRTPCAIIHNQSSHRVIWKHTSILGVRTSFEWHVGTPTTEQNVDTSTIALVDAKRVLNRKISSCCRMKNVVSRETDLHSNGSVIRMRERFE